MPCFESTAGCRHRRPVPWHPRTLPAGCPRPRTRAPDAPDTGVGDGAEAGESAQNPPPSAPSPYSVSRSPPCLGRDARPPNDAPEPRTLVDKCCRSQRRPSRMSTRGNPSSTDPVSAAFAKPADSKSACADVGHRQVHPRPVVVHRVPLDSGRAAFSRIVDRALDQRVRDALPAISGAHAETPPRPHVAVVDMRDEPVAGEARLPPRMQRRPSHGLAVEVGDHAGRWILLAQFPHAIGACGAAKRAVLPGTDAVAQAEAHIRRRLLRPHQRGDIVEHGRRAHLDAHVPSLAPIRT